MFRDDRLEYKNGTLQLKLPEIPGPSNDKKKPRRTTKFDFSGTNYEVCTIAHVACLETMLEEAPELIETICRQAKEIAGVRKPAGPSLALACDDKYTSLQADPEFAARASLFKKGKIRKSKDVTHKANEDFKGDDNEDFNGDNNEDFKGDDNEDFYCDNDRDNLNEGNSDQGSI
jgi:hypothetical protein